MKKLCIRAIAAGALAVGALAFVWLGGADATSGASCAPAGGYVVQFCVNFPSGEAVRGEATITLNAVVTTETDDLVKAGALKTFDDALETALAADLTSGIVDQTTLTATEERPVATQPPRAPMLARSHPRSFWTYDTLVEYASSVAAEQGALNESLAALAVRDGLIEARADLMDDVTMATLRTQVTNDAASRKQLLASGAVANPQAAWRLPLVGEITQEFGPTPFWFEPALTYGGVFYKHFHAGTDIAAPWGAPIYAPAGGTVVFAGTMGDGAEVVVIAHDSGLVSLYAHLENHVFPLPVKAGDTVQGGDRVGNVGLTGITTGAHLHWSVWRNGDPIDPLSLIGG